MSVYTKQDDTMLIFNHSLLYHPTFIHLSQNQSQKPNTQVLGQDVCRHYHHSSPHPTSRKLHYSTLSTCGRPASPPVQATRSQGSHAWTPASESTEHGLPHTTMQHGTQLGHQEPQHIHGCSKHGTFTATTGLATRCIDHASGVLSNMTLGGLGLTTEGVCTVKKG